VSGATVQDAHRHCATVTRRQAANFYYGIRLLTRPKREALCAIYACARAVDDIGDGPMEPEAKLAALAGQRSAIERLDPESDDLVIKALAAVSERFPLPRDAFLDLIDGVSMDLAGTHYETFEDLVVYCRRVAGSIGRLCLAVFESDDPGASALADDLGVAMQLTNILRDVREDAGIGRVYLPAQDLRRFDWPGGERADASAVAAASGSTPGSLSALVHFEAARNREWFERGLKLVPLLDRRSGACVKAMSQIYRDLLEQIDASPEAILAGRVRLSVWSKGRIAIRSLLGRAG
jgi:15-cis-phytoene synthase